MDAWLLTGRECEFCGYPIVVTQAVEQYCDYWFYCANPECPNHNPGEQLGDTEACSFAVLEKE